MAPVSFDNIRPVSAETTRMAVVLVLIKNAIKAKETEEKAPA